MKAVIQRVSNSSVEIDNNIHSKIENGLLVLIGFAKEDKEQNLEKTVNKILKLRIFTENNKFHLSVKDIEGEVLIVSQFTLIADTNKGRRPEFFGAMEQDMAKEYYLKFIELFEKNYKKEKIKSGVFGANMKVNLTNDGPITIIL
ncbi:UNVERIFIED_CONTAM: hypothetical protein GTU68_061738 [Idotea baltica]|nr:hypothetical protein [Idotea baltica]